MEIQAKTYYALLVLVDLAKNAVLATATMPVIAERNKLSTAFLKKILHNLMVEGLVKSVRGPHGGYSLGRDADKITVYDVCIAVQQSVEFKSVLKADTPESKSINKLFEDLHKDILVHYQTLRICDLAV